MRGGGGGTGPPDPCPGSATVISSCTGQMTSIERFHSRVQHLCKFIGRKESFYIRKEFNSHRIGLKHQHGHRFIVLRKRSIELGWPAAMQIYCDKTKGLHKKRCSTPTALFWDNNMATVSLIVLGYYYGRRDVLWKGFIVLYSLRLLVYFHMPIFFRTNVRISQN